MVIQSHEGFISLLPAVGDELKDGYFENLCARGGYTVSAKWADCKITEFTVMSDIKKEVTVELPEAQADAVLKSCCGCEFKAENGKFTLPVGMKFTVR